MGGRLELEGWAGTAFGFPPSRAALFRNPAKGPLWPYIRDIDIYRCPRGRVGNALTYATVISANGADVAGTYVPDPLGRESCNEPGARVGGTVLKLTRLTDMITPGPGVRAVFTDIGQTPTSPDLFVQYLFPQWFSDRPSHTPCRRRHALDGGRARRVLEVEKPRNPGKYRGRRTPSTRCPACWWNTWSARTTNHRPKMACTTSNGSKERPGADWDTRPRKARNHVGWAWVPKRIIPRLGSPSAHAEDSTVGGLRGDSMVASRRRRGLSLFFGFAWGLACCTSAWGIEFAGGTGEPNDPYQIATPAQLLAIGSDPDSEPGSTTC